MRKVLGLSFLAVAFGCGGDDGPSSVFHPTPAGPNVDGGTTTHAPMDAGVVIAISDGATACEPIAVCRDGKTTTLYNVCLAGGSSAPGTGTQTCLVSPEGTAYLVPLSGQTVVNVGWRQAGASGAKALTADDQQHCTAALAALSVPDASMMPPCVPL